ncbi:MAG: ribose 5-phosphate isomerase B [Alphaproteobacteria bacterium]|nr:ribose 5-phosphate isomerase B [Alphaproteobacteria bacterium]
MTEIIVALAADHAGFSLKEKLKSEVESMNIKYIDLGTNDTDPVDYSDYGKKVAEALVHGSATRGVVVCGTGIGISIAANRIDSIRAAVCHDVTTARLARLHNDANIISMGARVIGQEVAKECLRVFLSTSFEGGERHLRRIVKLG